MCVCVSQEDNQQPIRHTVLAMDVYANSGCISTARYYVVVLSYVVVVVVVVVDACEPDAPSTALTLIGLFRLEKL